MNNAGFLLDVNVLIAFVDENHVHHRYVRNWFFRRGEASWGMCAFTEAGFLRVTTRERTGGLTILQAADLLAQLRLRSGYRYWSITESWTQIVAPFASRIYGHQQVTDAYLLGVAVKESGILVTMDKAVSYLAGPQYSNNVLVLE
jgi:uncharacterized protein